MTRDRIEKLAEEIAQRDELRVFALDPAKLAAAIRLAKEWHDSDVAMFAERDPATSLVPRLARFRSSVERALAEWEGIEVGDRDYVGRFVGDDQPDHVREQLTAMLELMDEFEEHYGRRRGNPQRSRDGQNLDLRPLYAFVEILRDFWQKATGADMGTAVEDRDRDTGEASQAGSPAMILLGDAVTALDAPYSVTSLQTVVRSLKHKENYSF